MCSFVLLMCYKCGCPIFIVNLLTLNIPSIYGSFKIGSQEAF